MRNYTYMRVFRLKIAVGCMSLMQINGTTITFYECAKIVSRPTHTYKISELL